MENTANSLIVKMVRKQLMEQQSTLKGTNARKLLNSKLNIMKNFKNKRNFRRNNDIDVRSDVKRRSVKAIIRIRNIRAVQIKSVRAIKIDI